MIVFVLAWLMGAGSPVTLTYSQLLQQVSDGKVESVVVSGSNSGVGEARSKLRDGSTVRTVLPPDYKDALAIMLEKRVNVEFRDGSLEPMAVLKNATPFLLLLVVWIVLMSRGQRFVRRFRN